MSPWLAVLIALVGAVGGGAGIASLMTARATKRQIIGQAKLLRSQADETVAGAARVLIGGASDLVEPLRRQLDAAEARAEQINTQAKQINGQLLAAERRADQLEGQLERLRGWIHDPYMTIEQLRARVPAPPGANGTAP